MMITKSGAQSLLLIGGCVETESAIKSQDDHKRLKSVDASW